MRLWIDTDVGSDVDDALTLAYALRHEEIELVGVSTVFGDVGLRAEIAHALLACDGAGHIPVVEGLGVPLTTGRHGLMFGHEGKGILADPQPRMRTENEAEEDRATRVATLANAVAKARPDALLAIGPLSNLGALVDAGLSLPPLAIMGGKIEEVMLEGMVPGISEWNWYCDPLAVQKVLAAPAGTLPRIVPAEVTFRTALEEGDIARLSTGNSLAQQLGVLSEEWLDFLRERFGREKPRVALHDPLTAAILVETGLCPFEERRIRLDDDAVAHHEEGLPNVQVATDVDVEHLRRHLMETWLG